jgi:hypothetical protein
MTSLKFNGGDILRVDLDFERVCDLLEKALAHGTLMAIDGPDGYEIKINPQTVQFVQNGVGRRIYSGPGEESSPDEPAGIVRGA